MIDRPRFKEQIRRAMARARAVMLVGPRQSGKSTLAREFLPRDHPNYFDLEDPADRGSLTEPMATLAPLRGLVVIDEVQHAPDLFRVLRVLIDRDNRPGQYLLLGSASPALLRQTNESLLGRVEVIEIAGFDLQEVGIANAARLWLRGGFPPAFTAANDQPAIGRPIPVMRRSSLAPMPKAEPSSRWTRISASLPSCEALLTAAS